MLPTVAYVEFGLAGEISCAGSALASADQIDIGDATAKSTNRLTSTIAAFPR